jgi:hypothetical protein
LEPPDQYQKCTELQASNRPQQSVATCDMLPA